MDTAKELIRIAKKPELLGKLPNQSKMWRSWFNSQLPCLPSPASPGWFTRDAQYVGYEHYNDGVNAACWRVTAEIDRTDVDSGIVTGKMRWDKSVPNGTILDLAPDRVMIFKAQIIDNRNHFFLNPRSWNGMRGFGQLTAAQRRGYPLKRRKRGAERPSPFSDTRIDRTFFARVSVGGQESRGVHLKSGPVGRSGNMQRNELSNVLQPPVLRYDHYHFGFHAGVGDTFVTLIEARSEFCTFNLYLK